MKKLPCPRCGKLKRLSVQQMSRMLNSREWEIGWGVQCAKCCMSSGIAPTKEEAIEAWNSLSRRLRWTTELPALTKFGYYWWKKERNVVPSIVYVTPVTASRPLKAGEENHQEVFFFSRSAPLDARTLGGYWAGPITEPI